MHIFLQLLYRTSLCCVVLTLNDEAPTDSDETACLENNCINNNKSEQESKRSKDLKTSLKDVPDALHHHPKIYIFLPLHCKVG